MSGLNVSVAAVDLWGRFSTNNKASAYLWCQSFAGFYVPWAATGVEPSITYDSARLAALASDIFTKDVNDGSVQPGDNIFFVWGSDWHVVNVIGRDSSGRVLVVDTSSSGDVVRSLGRHVYIRHADTIGLQVYGVSRTNGRNPRVTFPGWSGDGGSANSPASTGGQLDLSGANWAWYDSAENAAAQQHPHGREWTGEKYARGVYAVLGRAANGSIQVRANDGSAIWISGEAASLLTGSVPTPAPAPAQAARKFTPPDGSAYWYTNRDDANALRNVHGNGNGDSKWYTDDPMVIGTYDVVEDPGDSFGIRAKTTGETIWISGRLRNGIS